MQTSINTLTAAMGDYLTKKLTSKEVGAVFPQVVANLDDAFILFIGDSTTWAGPPGIGYINSYPCKTAEVLSQYIPVSIRNRAGDGEAGVSLMNAYDPNITMGGWSVGPGATIGGKYFLASTNGASMTVNNPEPWDVFEEIYIRAAPGEALNVGSITLTGPTSETTTVDAKAGVGTGVARLKLSRAAPATGLVSRTAALDSGESFYSLGWVFRNTKRRAVHFVNAGIRGANSGTSNVTPLGLSRSTGQDFVMCDAIFGVWRPSATFINIGINDYRTGGLNPGVATYKINMQTIIDEARKTGPVILCVPTAIAAAEEGPVSQATYRTAIYELAAANNLAVLDFQTVLGTYTESVAAGTQSDTLHPNAAGYAKMATAAASMLVSVLRRAQAGTGAELLALRSLNPTNPNAVREAIAIIPLVDAATIYVDLSKGSRFEVTLGGNRTMGTPRNAVPGQSFVVFVRQPASGGPRTLSYASVWTPFGSLPTASTAANAVDQITGIVDKNGKIRFSMAKGGAA